MDYEQTSGGFGFALSRMRGGAKVRRASWDSGAYIRRAEPSDFMNEPSIMTGSGKGETPWLAPQADLLAEDWEVTNG